MKKTILSFILVITAFLGVNLLKVNIYAETTPWITYDNEGNRVYVHFGVATSDDGLFTTQTASFDETENR